MKYIKDKNLLYERVCSMLLKNIKTKDGQKYHINNPKDVIEDVEFDPENGGADMDKPSYWVYLKDGFITENGCGCHTIHEDTLKDVKSYLRDVVYDEEDANTVIVWDEKEKAFVKNKI